MVAHTTPTLNGAGLVCHIVCDIHFFVFQTHHHSNKVDSCCDEYCYNSAPATPTPTQSDTSLLVPQSSPEVFGGRAEEGELIAICST